MNRLLPFKGRFTTFNPDLQSVNRSVIPETTNIETTTLTVEAPAYTAIHIVHAAEPDTCCIVTCRTPPVSEVANAVEITTATHAARKPGESTTII